MINLAHDCLSDALRSKKAFSVKGRSAIYNAEADSKVRDTERNTKRGILQSLLHVVQHNMTRMKLLNIE
jgi:hypothetical protein